jgi:hypothetical protein
MEQKSTGAEAIREAIAVIKSADNINFAEKKKRLEVLEKKLDDFEVSKAFDEATSPAESEYAALEKMVSSMGGDEGLRERMLDSIEGQYDAQLTKDAEAHAQANADFMRVVKSKHALVDAIRYSHKLDEEGVPADDGRRSVIKMVFIGKLLNNTRVLKAVGMIDDAGVVETRESILKILDA